MERENLCFSIPKYFSFGTCVDGPFRQVGALFEEREKSPDS